METARNFHKFKTNIRVSKRKTKSSMFQRSWSFGTPFRHNGKESLEKPRKRDMNTWPLQYYGLNTTLILWQPAFLIWPNCEAAKQNGDALKMVRRYLIVFLNEGMSTITQKKNNSRLILTVAKEILQHFLHAIWMCNLVFLKTRQHKIYQAITTAFNWTVIK